MNKPRKWLTAALAAGALTAAALPLQAAIADSSPPGGAVTFTVRKDVKLLANGVAIRPVFVITCQPGTIITQQTIEVAQTVRKGNIARGFATSFQPPINCDGTPQRFPMTAFAQNLAFKKGVALATSNVFACADDFSFCQNYTETKTLNLVK
jgi:hypothetical protein